MIVRERATSFILIEQAKHGILAKDVFQALCGHLLQDDPYRDVVLDAIQSHDDGWAFVDSQPFWNDEKAMPYHFLDFPTPSKIPFYHYGIDLVTKRHPYAGALCSAHYARFLSRSDQQSAIAFVENESKRQAEIIQDHPDADFKKHFAMLRLADNLSLFLSLNELGTSAEDIHFFFRKGIAVPVALHGLLPAYLGFEWQETLLFKGIGQSLDYKAILPYREIEKNALAELSLAKAYEMTETKYESIPIKAI